MDDQQVADRGDGSDPRFSVKAAISRETVRLYKTAVRPRADQSRTEFAGPDIVLSTLEHSFTPAERKLVGMGQLDRVRDMRTYFQHATEPEFCGAIERILDRKVRGFTSGIDVVRDISTECFFLESDDGDSRDGDGSP